MEKGEVKGWRGELTDAELEMIKVWGEDEKGIVEPCSELVAKLVKILDEYERRLSVQ